MEEAANTKYKVSYVWNDGTFSDGNVFEPVIITANGTLAYTNKLAAVQVVLKKVGVNNTDLAATETDLSGATFTFYTAETGGLVAKDAAGAELSGKTSDSSGVFFSGKLLPGKYYLEETETPAGYNTPLGRFELEVISAESEPTIKASWFTGNQSHVVGSVSSSSNESGDIMYTVSVRNITGVVIPSTGSSGTLTLSVIGTSLTLLAAAGYVLANLPRRKEDGASRERE